MKKVQISVDENLLNQIDNAAEENYMSRSGFISFACAQYLQGRQVQRSIVEMTVLLRTIADRGTLDEETKKKLQEFEEFTKLITVKN